MTGSVLRTDSIPSLLRMRPPSCYHTDRARVADKNVLVPDFRRTILMIL
jgi:hypothetical protein